MIKKISAALAVLLAFTLAATPAHADGQPLGSVPDWGIAPSAILDWDIAPSAPPRSSAQDVLLTNPRKILKKAPPSRGAQSRLLATSYFYAGAEQTASAIVPAVTTAGATVQALPNPLYMNAADAHTLVEVSVRKTAWSNCGVVEAGITVDPVVNPDSQPRLFVFAWDKNCAGIGYNTSFTLAAGRTISPGDVVSTNSPMIWYYETATQRWWLQYQGAYVGYFANSVFGASFTFDKVGQYLGFGEIANTGGAAFSCSDMGTGDMPTATVGRQFGSTSFNGAGTNVNLTAFATSVGASPGYSEYMQSARTYRYGGPGTNSVGGLPGNVGSC